MITRLFLAAGAFTAANADTGAFETIKNILLILFLAVGVVWLFIDARRNLIATYGGAEPVQTTTSRGTSANRATEERPAPEVLAVIAAAVHSTFGSRSRIVSISGDDDDAQSWAAEGRRAIYATRKVR